jgi:alpha-beta hydrolase superfamily lysophospholipase
MILKYLVKFTANLILSILFVLALLLLLYAKSLPELKEWHSKILSSEFSVSSPIKNFGEYLNLEKTLFLELEEQIEVPNPGHPSLNRFHKDSLAYPKQQAKNGNRSFILESPSPSAGVLLLHGMSDSPYSLMQIGRALNKKDAFVLGLRLPGHGTAPSGLLTATWEDMAAAVDLAMAYLAEQAEDKPLYIIGYSNGGSLGLLYALSQLEQDVTPKLSGLILISPAIGVAPIAALAKWQERLSLLPGLEKLAWTDIQPEYNPFKYSSFPVNAGNQVYQLTREIQQRLEQNTIKPGLEKLPSILAFQSIVDSTVSTPALINNLFNKLPRLHEQPGLDQLKHDQLKHELIIFDINRSFGLKSLITMDPINHVHGLLKKTNLSFRFEFISNENDKQTISIFARQKKGSDITISPLGIKWPEGLYSLSHVALPFSETDILYGKNKTNLGLNIGGTAPRGEKGILKIPVSEIMRLKWNPFYPYMEKKIIEKIFPTRPVQLLNM